MKPWIRDPRQIGAWMDKDSQNVPDKVLIKQPADATQSSVDPLQSFWLRQFLRYSVGAQNHDKQVLYQTFTRQ